MVNVFSKQTVTVVQLDLIASVSCFPLVGASSTSDSLSDGGVYSSSLSSSGGTHGVSLVTIQLHIFSKSLRFHRSMILKLINTIYECSATSTLTDPVLLHLFFMGSHIQTGSPDFCALSIKVVFVLPSVCSFYWSLHLSGYFFVSTGRFS